MEAEIDRLTARVKELESSNPATLDYALAEHAIGAQLARGGEIVSLRLAELEAKNAALQAKIKELEEENARLTTTIKDLEDEIESLDCQIQELGEMSD